MVRSVYQFIKRVVSEIRNIVFYKILLVFIIAITIPVTITAYISIKHSTENILTQVRNSSISSLSEKKDMLDMRLEEIDKIIFQIFNNKNLRTLTGIKEYTFSRYKAYTSFGNLLNNIRIANKLVDSIYVYDIDNDYKISSPVTSTPEFKEEDVEPIELGLKNEHLVIRRELNGSDVISFIRNLRNIGYNGRFVIVVNVNYKDFFSLQSSQSSGKFDTLIFDDKCTEILLRSETLTSVEDMTMNAIMVDENPSGLYSIDGTEYFVCKARSDVIDWNIVHLQPYSSIVQEAQLTRKLILSSLLIVLLLSLVLACIYSLYIYKPIGRLVTKVREQITPGLSCSENAYTSIDNTMMMLFHKNRELMSKYQAVFPYFKQYSVNDLLSGEMFDIEKFSNILNLLGINFIHSRYVNVVIDFENTGFSENERSLLDSALSAFKKEMAYVIFNINAYRASAIINTNMPDSDIYNTLDMVKQDLNNRDINVTISVSSSYINIEEAYAHHREALVLMDNKFFTGKNKIILGKDQCKVARKFKYDKKLEEKLISCINAQDRRGAKNALSLLIQEIVGNTSSIDYIRYVYFQVIYNIIDSLDAIGIDLQKVNISSAEIFDNIQKSDTLGDLREFAENTIFKCIDLIGGYRSIQHEVIVDKVLEFLRNNYHDNIGLEEAASKVYLSPGYLNNIFKASTGTTVYEYITRLRMESAAKLLKNSSSKIQDIATQVGYNSAQSFIRLFKKYYNMTPIEFRRNLLNGLAERTSF